MPISKTITMPNRSVASFHYVRRYEVSFLEDKASATILSYPDEDAFLSGAGPVWNSPVAVPISVCDGEGSINDKLENWLSTTTPIEGAIDFKGGIIVGDNSQSFETLRARTWAKIKTKRSFYEYNGFNCRFGRFDSDEESTSRIVGSTTAAMMAKTAGVDWSVDWTLANNDIVTLTADDMVEVAAAAFKHVSDTHEFARQLRIKIDLAMTVEDLDAILAEIWPAVMIS